MSVSPPPLAPGARIGVFAPSGIHDPERLARSIALVGSWGWRVVRGPHLGCTHRYLAGTDDERLADLIWALTDPGLDAAWMARGGSGLPRLLDRVPWEQVRATAPRPIIGFSDGTALMAALHGRAGWRGVHGPVLHSLADHADRASREYLRALLAGEDTPSLAGRVVQAGQARGEVVGGNLCLLAALCGTPDQVSCDGKILVVEEIGEAAYRVDRTLCQLRAAGALAGVAGVAVGTFSGLRVPEGAGWGLDEILREYFPGVPIAADLPIGHGRANRAFLYGAPGWIRADGDGAALGWGEAGGIA